MNKKEQKNKTAVDFLYEFCLMKLPEEERIKFEVLFKEGKEIFMQQIQLAYYDGANDMENNTYKGMKKYFEKNYQ